MCDYKKLFCEVLVSYHNHEKWDNAIFKDIKIISNTKVGAVGQDFIEKLCHDLNISCEFPVNKMGQRANQSSWDIAINHIQFELKTATEDTNENFQFNHIRYHRPYDALLCLGVSPNELYFGIWSKADVVTGKAGHLVSMEKGANASYKLTKNALQLNHIDTFQKKIAQFTLSFKSNK